MPPLAALTLPVPKTPSAPTVVACDASASTSTLLLHGPSAVVESPSSAGEQGNEQSSVAYTSRDDVPVGILADLNDDDAVDGADLGLLLSMWGESGAGDLDCSGVVDGADLGLLLGAWTE
jgi:hypothetical protein